MKQKKSLGKLFCTLLKVGTFTLGGGYAMLPIMRAEFVEKLRWFEDEEFLDIIALSQAVPGAMVVNLSVYVGHTLFGYGGAALALLAIALPSLVIMGAVAYAYMWFRERGSAIQTVLTAIRPAVVGIILAAAVRMTERVGTGWVSCLLMIAAVAVVGVTALGISPIYCIAGGGAIGMLLMRERGAKIGE